MQEPIALFESLAEQFVSEFDVKHSEIVDTLVFACISNRFIQLIQNFVRNELGIKEFDLKTDAGSVRQIDTITRNYSVFRWIIDNFKICINSHKINHVIIFAHFDCGGYGGNESFSSFEDQLKKMSDAIKSARKVIKQECPELKVSAYLMVLTSANQGGILPIENE